MPARTKRKEPVEPASPEIKRLLADAVKKYAVLKKRPKVGIFWYHNKKVLGDFFELAGAEVYGNVVGPHSNHYDFWAKIQAENLDLSSEEYEFTPRGRVLFDLIEGTFVIISSAAIIANKSALKSICRHCNIPDNFLVTLKTDQHYENPNDLDWED